MLVENKRGGYSFLKGISPYSAGAVAQPGFAIEHARLRAPLGVAAGFAAMDAHLKSFSRPRTALCAIELRSPQPFTFQGFSDFNAGYVGILKSWDLLQEGLNPIARTNVAPEISPPEEPSLFGFSYTVVSADAKPSFVVAGAGELPEGSLGPHDVVRKGETSNEALQEKARFVMNLMDGRLHGLGVRWADVTQANLYTVHPFFPWLNSEILSKMGSAQLQGVHWYLTRPPIVSIEFEMDLRGVAREMMIG
ncbi:MAG: RidA family protein [Acidobacteria bacterium]|nr:RidA family protein [Acidobacteriota bacterium]